jgi:hypothetical protein
MHHRRSASFLVLLAAVIPSGTLFAVDADPSNYEAVVPTLTPGSTLTLAAGTYTGNLDLVGLQGTADAPIVIEGPADKSARFTANACCNTVEITDASHLVLRNLTIDGGGAAGVFGVSAKGSSNVVHHITVEDCLFIGHGGSQQTVAISTKSPTWGWVIRGNVIDGAGTGLYLGNSDGSQPFVDGLIERNLVKNTIGYNMQIKYQSAWPAGTELPTNATSTVIRDNVFIKNDDPSPDGDRPNVLVGGFPETGPGSENQVEIVGNFFFHNPRESLLQASGRVSIHDNVFVDAASSALLVTNHDLPLRRARIYHNTFYSADTAVSFGSAASEGDFVAGNLIFAGAGISGSVSNDLENLVFDVSEAATVVANPSLTLGEMDFYPLVGQAQGAAIDLSAVTSDVDFDLDFNRTDKGAATHRGAYAGDGRNPGWQLDDGLKTLNAAGGGGVGGGSGGGAEGGAGTGGESPTTNNSTAAGAGDLDDREEGGCDCRAVGSRRDHAWLALLGVSALIVGAARRRTRSRIARHLAGR